MRIQATVMLIVACTACSLYGADTTNVSRFKVPADWNTERISLPPSFAPDMKLTGTEEIWFAPGMFKPKSDSFFSYMFVFHVEPKPKLTQEVLEQEFLAYYRGLATAVLKGQDVSVETKKFALKLKPVKIINEAAQAPAGMRQFTGDLNWVEPFVTRKQQTLHLEIDTWTDSKSNRNFLFVCVSPHDNDAKIWKTLRTLRGTFLDQSRNALDADALPEKSK